MILTTLLVATAAALTIMTLTWVWAVKIDNYSLVDGAWAMGFSAIAAVYLTYAQQLSIQKLIYILMILFWSQRLGFHLFNRILKHHPKEDVRYQRLRETFKVGMKKKFFYFFMAQAISQVVLSTPFFLYLCLGYTRQWHKLEIAGFILFPIALYLESLADKQLADFRANEKNKGKVCNVGLWNFSRHPNYFFEFMIWVSFALPALTAPYGWLSVTAPALILYLLLKVTGIPLTEELSIQSRGQAYLDYQKRTSAFVPWLPKK